MFHHLFGSAGPVGPMTDCGGQPWQHDGPEEEHGGTESKYLSHEFNVSASRMQRKSGPARMHLVGERTPQLALSRAFMKDISSILQLSVTLHGLDCFQEVHRLLEERERLSSAWSRPHPIGGSDATTLVI